MTKYVVQIDLLQLPGEEREVHRAGRVYLRRDTKVHSKGDEVEIEDKDQLKRFLDKGYVVAKGSEAEAKADDSDSTDTPKLTEKQQLQKDAEERGLSTDGTSAELKTRIAEHDEVNKDAEGNNGEQE